MNLREFLETRERELVTEINDLHGKLAPLEAELAEVRRARGALGIPLAPIGALGIGLINSTPSAALLSLLNEAADRATNIRRLIPGLGTQSLGSGQRVPVSHYADMTMKQLVVKALSEHFPEGATTRQLLDFFRDAWGRNIERTNLSPQLFRLFRDRVISRNILTREGGNALKKGPIRWCLLANPETDKLAAEDSEPCRGPGVGYPDDDE